MQPLVSIILPVYNAERYLRKAIDSLLTQTYTNFELIVIDDGSTDSSDNIIASYNDTRIIHLRNECNKGLIYTLNKGIEVAIGKYIARMDADDISLPQRLNKQVEWLERNIQTALVATFIDLIDENDNPAGVWQLDRDTTDASLIKKKMTYENCIAHPSIIARAAIFKEYRYSANQKHIEDYALWLEMLSDGYILEKITEPLLLYRIHSLSVTGSVHRKKNPFFMQCHCKWRFILGRFKKKKWSSFETIVFFTMVSNAIMGVLKRIKSYKRRFK